MATGTPAAERRGQYKNDDKAAEHREHETGEAVHGCGRERIGRAGEHSVRQISVVVHHVVD